MSPTADELAEQINRDLKPGDVLVRKMPSFLSRFRVNCEVVNPHVQGRWNKLLRPFGLKGEVDSVEVAELTSHGRSEETLLYRRKANCWNGIIRQENRAEGPSIRERER